MAKERAKERLTLYDTTLRDGAQTTGVDFSLDDKRQIAALLDDLGIDYIEGGYPGANPLDTEFFAQRPKLRARFAAFGMTRRQGRSVENDPGVAALLDSSADVVTFVAKSWDFQVRVALRSTEEDNLASVTQSVNAAVARGKEVAVDCEHFFDGFKANPDYALACARAAHAAGARWVVLCDTNGGTLPHEVERIVAEVVKQIPGDRVGVHCHDDTGQAVANSLAAVRAGARQIQGTLNGLGERCGNANLTTIIPTLLLKERIFRALRDRRDAGEADASDAREPCARRASQPRAQPPCALCRRQRLCDEGRHSRLGRADRSAHLRTCHARIGRQCAARARIGSGGTLEHRLPSSPGSASSSTRTIRV